MVKWIAAIERGRDFAGLGMAESRYKKHGEL